MALDLKKLRIGTQLKIVSYGSKNIPLTYRRKLIAMGLLPNTQFTLERIAPLGDPIQIKVKNTSLILRNREFNQLQLALDLI